MLNNANQELIEHQNEPVLRLIKNDREIQKKEYFLYYNSGVFPILIIVIFFLCVGVIINIGLRIQNMNYDKKIYSINQLISSEKERTDRLNLKVSELKSPSRIAEASFLKNEVNNNPDSDNPVSEKNNTDQATSEAVYPEGYRDFKNLDIMYSKTANDAVISSEEENNVENIKGLNFGSILSNAKDVLMVVSEGILTFFIP